MAYFIVIYAVCGIYMLLNFKYDLQMFQQNSYRADRYWKWLQPHIGDSWRLVDVACLFLMMASPQFLDYRLASLFVAIVAATKILLILRKKYKNPLVFTKRVWRLYCLTGLLSAGGITAVAICTYGMMTGIYSGPVITLSSLMLITIFSWAIVLLSHFLLIPVEKAIQQRYINDAKRILKSMPDLKVIGITGSFGKTSTKHYLTHILGETFDVLMTPGSFNTPMGVVRTVREHLKPYNQIFVCEMGAKQRGDIKEICDIVHPKIGIITAVGPMHLESFKSLENVQATKFELVDALPSDGYAVINNDFELCADRVVKNTRAIRYGITRPEGCDYIARDISYTPSGTTFTVEGKDGFMLLLETQLLGEGNISDLLAAVVVAMQMGVKPEAIRSAVATIGQVEHRLSMKRTHAGVTIIDDAFNSNPAGAKMAIDVLSHFKDGKRIVVTPGMIELGQGQYDLNQEFGKYLGNRIDVAIIVGQYNRDAIVEGIGQSDLKQNNLHLVDSFNDAQKILSGILSPGDTVLYENDLPDTFK